MRLIRLPRVESTVSSILTLGIIQLFAAVLLIAGLVDRQREIILLAAFILATVNVARLWARLSARRLSFQSSVSRSRLFPGEELVLSVRAENRKLLPVWVRAAIPDAPPRRPASAEESGTNGAEDGMWLDDWPVWDTEVARGGATSDRGAWSDESAEPTLLLEGETGLTAFQQVEWTRTLEARRRGAYLLGPVRMDAGDLLGFFRRREEKPVRMEVLVYPRLVPLASLTLPLREFFGLQKTRMPVEDPAFQIGTRDYQGNRPARHINWKASARRSTLQEKLYEPTAQVRVLFLIDAASFYVADLPGTDGRGISGAPADGGGEPGAIAGMVDEEAVLSAARAKAAASFERTIEVVASLASRLEQARVPIGLAVNGRLRGSSTTLLPPNRGAYQLTAILECLARLTSRPDHRAAGFTSEALRLTGTTTCVYALRAITGSTASALAALRSGRRTPVVLLAADLPVERGGPPRLEGIDPQRGAEHLGPAAAITVFGIDSLMQMEEGRP